MKTILKKAALLFATAIPTLITAQVDLTIGINYAYNPPTNCNNQLTSISIDVCNNGSSSASSFLVGIYLYEPSTTKHWVLDQVTVNSLSGNACTTISNWNINMNNYASLPAPGSNYRIGAWADTANVITETSKSNNASLLSGNIQVCAVSTGIQKLSNSVSAFMVSPNPLSDIGQLIFSLSQSEKVNVKIFDITGKPVSELFNGELAAGEQKISFDTYNLSAGVYFATVKTTTGTITRKLMVQK